MGIFSVKKTTEQFIKEANQKHNNFYNYSKTIYTGNKNKIIIICPTHGEFKQEAKSHLMGCGCPKCGIDKKTSNKENFIAKAKKIHNNFYSYNNFIYKNSRTKSWITCPVHGDFLQNPNNHLNGCNCPKCASNTTKTTKQFIEDAIKIHGDKYDYSLVDYKNAKTKVKIICPIHGDFLQNPNNHLQGHGCPKCTGKYKILEDFIQEAKQIHGDKYDYSLVDYKNVKTKVKIICLIHGVFNQTPDCHLQGQGCPDCGHNIRTTEQFIQEAKQIHGDKYDYNKSIYKKHNIKTEIICPIHGSFWQTPHHHLDGSGCPDCCESHGERDVAKYLTEHNLFFEREKKFNDCKNINFLPFDFYLPELNTCIEYDGRQHFESIEGWGGEKNLKEIQTRDQIKNKYCIDNNIKLIRIKYNENIEEKLSILLDKKSKK